jgi:hypothetical protein
MFESCRDRQDFNPIERASAARPDRVQMPRRLADMASFSHRACASRRRGNQPAKISAPDVDFAFPRSSSGRAMRIVAGDPARATAFEIKHDRQTII